MGFADLHNMLLFAILNFFQIVILFWILMPFIMRFLPAILNLPLSAATVFGL